MEHQDSVHDLLVLGRRLIRDGREGCDMRHFGT